MLRITFLVCLLATVTSAACGQSASLAVNVVADNRSLQGVHVLLMPGTELEVTDAAGNVTFALLPEGTYTLQATMVGYKTAKRELYLAAGAEMAVALEMHEDMLMMQQVTVTSSRGEVPLYNAPVIVSLISPRTFEATQSLSLAEGLAFAPGLRVENNCQNCGFTQLRMNGLDGAYSQVLINSRPVFSALAGVYGLEMLPPNMIDRIEVVRGGGSVLYGGNAIGGTVNIITREPLNNSFDFSANQAFTNFEASDRTYMANGAVVSDDLKMGATMYGYLRDRDPWDANGDGISQMPLLQNKTLGFDAFFNPSHRSKLKVGAYSIQEFRRGGSQFELPPHQTDLTEQLDHRILGANTSYETYSENYRHKISVYASMQSASRSSYYGTGGRVLSPGDSLTDRDILALNAYGNTTDLTAIGGVQYTFEFSEKANLTAGTEYQHYSLRDAIPGYNRSIEQRVGVTGSYAQLQWLPVKRLTLLLGGRFDAVDIDGKYDLQDETFDNSKNLGVFVPRISAMYTINERLKARASVAQGYRAPQVFDEDLHVETVGGNVLFVRFDPGLRAERGNSYTASLNYSSEGARQLNLVAEGFLTRLSNPFILSDQTTVSEGISVITKRNGGAATVQGVNLEANMALSRKWILQSGATLQTARYASTEVVWAPEADDSNVPSVSTDRMLRSPDLYGYFTLQYTPSSRWTASLSGVYAGPMYVAHVVGDEQYSDFTVIKRTQSFFEQNFKVSHTLYNNRSCRIQLFGGVQNIFNAYQNDFDRGPLRDGGYVYGPMRPRTLFFGLKLGLT